MKRSILALSMATLALGACKKYENGGFIGKGDERIVAEWKLNSYLRNGNDETSTLTLTNFKETYSEGGVMTRTYTVQNGDLEGDNGKYEFKDDNKTLHISDASSIKEFSSIHKSLSSSKADILKLTKDELWYRFENSGDLHEFHFKK